MSASDDHDPDIHNGYVGISSSELEVMADSELAQWQHNHSNEPPKVILAEQEWQRRRMIRALTEQFRLEERIAKVNRWWGMGVAVIGVVGTLAGAWLGAQWQASATSSGASVKLQLPPQPSAPADALQRATPASARR